jgi:dienelactone hydrolase
MSESDDVRVERQDDFDIYRPADREGSLPAVIFVHGPAPAGRRPRESPFFAGYGRLLAGRGLAAVVPDVRYQGLDNWPPNTMWPPHVHWEGTAKGLAAVVDRIREQPGIDSGRTAIWAFSGGGMLTGSWLAESPAWLQCLALTYPVLADQTPDSTTPAPSDLVRPGRPIALTRVGRERPEIQATVDRFLAHAEQVGASVEVIDVLEAGHGFDATVPELQSCQPVLSAADFVTRHLTRPPM